MHDTLIDDEKDNVRYSEITLVAEIARYPKLSCLTVSKIKCKGIFYSLFHLDFLKNQTQFLKIKLYVQKSE